MGAWIRSCAAAAVVAATLSAHAAPTVYFGEDLNVSTPGEMVNSLSAQASFLSLLSGYGIEGFESFAAGTTGALNLGFGSTGVTATLSGAGSVLDAPSNGRFAVDGTHYMQSSFSRRITFSAPVSAFGLFVTDANEVDNNPAVVTVGGSTLTAAQIDARPYDSVDGIFRIVTERSPGVFETLFAGGTFPADLTGMFVGITDEATPFTNIILINGASGLDGAFTDNFGYDGLIAGTVTTPVPEPGTMALLIAGLGALAARRNAAKKRD